MDAMTFKSLISWGGGGDCCVEFLFTGEVGETVVSKFYFLGRWEGNGHCYVLVSFPREV